MNSYNILIYYYCHLINVNLGHATDRLDMNIPLIQEYSCDQLVCLCCGIFNSNLQIYNDIYKEDADCDEVMFQRVDHQQCKFGICMCEQRDINIGWGVLLLS